MPEAASKLRQPELRYCHANGVKLAYFEWGAPRADAPTLLFVHATGFHGRLWDALIEAFPNHHCIALEQRGHGRSEKRAVRHWQTFGQDQAAFIRALGLRNLVGIAHSMGAHAMIDAAAISGAFDSLLLLDPTVAAPEQYREATPPDPEAPLHPASRRRNTFDSVAAMKQQIQDKSAFPQFVPRILHDYCQYGLEPTPEGALKLCCEPEIEAWVYMTARTNGAVYDSVRRLQIPVTIVRARTNPDPLVQDFSSSPTWPGLAEAFPKGREFHWADCTHFVPMQCPDEVVERIKDALMGE